MERERRERRGEVQREEGKENGAEAGIKQVSVGMKGDKGEGVEGREGGR